MSDFTFKYPTITLAGRLHTLCEQSSMPITVINGEMSDLLRSGRKNLDKLQSQYPNLVQLKLFPKSGHHVQVQKPFEVAWYILESVLDTEGLPALNKESVRLSMLMKDHLSSPLRLLPHDMPSAHLIHDSHWDKIVLVTIIFPLLAVVVFVLVFVFNFILQSCPGL